MRREVLGQVEGIRSLPRCLAESDAAHPGHVS